MHAPIHIVSGLPRSGTSLMMQMLTRGGLDPLTDEQRQPDEDNPRGYFELEAVKRTSSDASWLGHAHGRVVKVISRLLGDLPVDQAYRYKVVFMRRTLNEVLRSQRAMLDRRGERAERDRDDVEMKQVYVSHLEDVETWLRTRADIEVLFVSYNRVLSDPRKQAERVNAFCDDALDIEAMVAAVDRSLYRNR